MSIPTDYGNRLTSFAGPVDQKEDHLTRKKLQLIQIAVDRSGDGMAEDAYFRALMGSAPTSSQLDEWIMSEIFSPQQLSERKAGQLAASLESLPEKLGFNNTFALVLYGYKLTTALQEESQVASQRDNLKRAESLFATKLCELSYDPRYKNINLTTLQFKPEQITPTFISELKEKQLQAQRWASYTKTALITLGTLGAALSIGGLIYYFTPKGIEDNGGKQQTSPDTSKKIDGFLKKDEPDSQSWSILQVIGTITTIGGIALGCLGLKRCLNHYADTEEQERIQKLNDFISSASRSNNDADSSITKQTKMENPFYQKPSENNLPTEICTDQQDCLNKLGEYLDYPGWSKAGNNKSRKEREIWARSGDGICTKLSLFLSNNRENIRHFILEGDNQIQTAMNTLKERLNEVPSGRDKHLPSSKENLVKKIELLLKYATFPQKGDLVDKHLLPPIEFESEFLWNSNWIRDGDWMEAELKRFYRKVNDLPTEKCKDQQDCINQLNKYLDDSEWSVADYGLCHFANFLSNNRKDIFYFISVDNTIVTAMNNLKNCIDQRPSGNQTKPYSKENLVLKIAFLVNKAYAMREVKCDRLLLLPPEIRHDQLWNRDWTGDGDGVKKDLFQEQLKNSQKPIEIEKTEEEEREEESEKERIDLPPQDSNSNQIENEKQDIKLLESPTGSEESESED